MEEIKTIEFQDGPLVDLISELNNEASKWCEKNCPQGKGFFAKPFYSPGNLPCFGGAVFHLELIEECERIPELYKLYWKAKAKNICAIWPLIINKEANHE